METKHSKLNPTISLVRKYPLPDFICLLGRNGDHCMFIFYTFCKYQNNWPLYYIFSNIQTFKILLTVFNFTFCAIHQANV